MSRVIHFEIPVDDPERANKFYSGVFGWEINNWGGPMEYWLVGTGAESEPGINGGIMRRTHPGEGVCNTIGVENLEESMAKVTASGGKVITDRMTVPGVGYMAYCQDTEGNTFGMMQSDTNAK